MHHLRCSTQLNPKIVAADQRENDCLSVKTVFSREAAGALTAAKMIASRPPH
jgi:hypothetical protein